MRDYPVLHLDTD